MKKRKIHLLIIFSICLLITFIFSYPIVKKTLLLKLATNIISSELGLKFRSDRVIEVAKGHYRLRNVIATPKRKEEQNLGKWVFDELDLFIDFKWKTKELLLDFQSNSWHIHLPQSIKIDNQFFLKKQNKKKHLFNTYVTSSLYGTLHLEKEVHPIYFSHQKHSSPHLSIGTTFQLTAEEKNVHCKCEEAPYSLIEKLQLFRFNWLQVKEGFFTGDIYLNREKKSDLTFSGILTAGPLSILTPETTITIGDNIQIFTKKSDLFIDKFHFPLESLDCTIEENDTTTNFYLSEKLSGLQLKGTTQYADNIFQGTSLLTTSHSNEETLFLFQCEQNAKKELLSFTGSTSPFKNRLSIDKSQFPIPCTIYFEAVLSLFWNQNSYGFTTDFSSLMLQNKKGSLLFPENTALHYRSSDDRIPFLTVEFQNASLVDNEKNVLLRDLQASLEFKDHHFLFKNVEGYYNNLFIQLDAEASTKNDELTVNLFPTAIEGQVSELIQALNIPLPLPFENTLLSSSQLEEISEKSNLFMVCTDDEIRFHGELSMNIYKESLPLTSLHTLKNIHLTLLCDFNNNDFTIPFFSADLQNYLLESKLTTLQKNGTPCYSFDLNVYNEIQHILQLKGLYEKEGDLLVVSSDNALSFLGKSLIHSFEAQFTENGSCEKASISLKEFTDEELSFLTSLTEMKLPKNVSFSLLQPTLSYKGETNEWKMHSSSFQLNELFFPETILTIKKENSFWLVENCRLGEIDLSAELSLEKNKEIDLHFLGIKWKDKLAFSLEGRYILSSGFLTGNIHLLDYDLKNLLPIEGHITGKKGSFSLKTFDPLNSLEINLPLYIPYLTDEFLLVLHNKTLKIKNQEDDIFSLALTTETLPHFPLNGKILSSPIKGEALLKTGCIEINSLTLRECHPLLVKVFPKIDTIVDSHYSDSLLTIDHMKIFPALNELEGIIRLQLIEKRKRPLTTWIEEKEQLKLSQGLLTFQVDKKGCTLKETKELRDTLHLFEFQKKEEPPSLIHWDGSYDIYLGAHPLTPLLQKNEIELHISSEK